MSTRKEARTIIKACIVSLQELEQRVAKLSDDEARVLGDRLFDMITVCQSILQSSKGLVRRIS